MNQLANFLHGLACLAEENRVILKNDIEIEWGTIVPQFPLNHTMLKCYTSGEMVKIKIEAYPHDTENAINRRVELTINLHNYEVDIRPATR